MPQLLVVDCDMLIDYLCDQPEVVAFLEGTEQPLAASVITVAELLRRQYGPSHGTGQADALNRRHFPMRAAVLVPCAKS
jgi:hypothetical protein